MSHAGLTKPPRILLVDDDAFQLELLAKSLAHLGITSVQTARSGQEGLETYRRSAVPPDLIVVDLCMPQLDGMELLQQLARERCQSNIVIVSGHNLTPPKDPNWRLVHYDGPVLHLAEKLAHLQGLHVRGSFEKPLTRDKVVAMLEMLDAPAAPAPKDEAPRAASTPPKPRSAR
ncbi:MAG: response regulator transcription factor [Rhodoferax sp.]